VYRSRWPTTINLRPSIAALGLSESPLESMTLMATLQDLRASL
jgi:hypothetical protein